MTKTIVTWLFGSIAVLMFGLWRYTQPPQPRTHVAILYDRSESMPQGCDSLVGLGQRAFSLPYVRDGSTLTLFTTGDRTIGYEPKLLTTYSLPVSRLATESNNRLLERQQAFLSDIAHRCSALPSTITSPIVLSIRQVLAHLSGLGDDHTVRYLLVRSDLQETADPAVKRALRQRPGTTPMLATSIDNDGINVVLCGSAEVVGQVPPVAARIKEVWERLFSQPRLVQFQPFCAQLPAQLEASH